MRLILVFVMLFSLSSPSFAAPYHWVDRAGFHPVDHLAKVPLPWDQAAKRLRG